LGAASTALGTIEDLKNDVKVLRSYSEPVKQKDVAIANEQLIKEMSELKRLVYVTLASCGLMLAAIAGIWIKNRCRLPYKQAIVRYLGKK
jgi:NAD(P)H-hydrate repair Nnr-like enzyme with NAD(P)H-hydrate epimerase domain